MIRNWLIGTSVAAFFLAKAPVQATELSLTFVESAPVDLLIVENQSDCDLHDFKMRIDLAPSAGGLLFDVSEGGAGASAYQPFELLEGHGAVRAFAQVEDGDRQALIEFNHLEARARVIFMIDLDNTLTQSAFGQTIVDAPEIAGATVTIITAGEAPLVSQFHPDGRAETRLGGCGPIS